MCTAKSGGGNKGGGGGGGRAGGGGANSAAARVAARRAKERAAATAKAKKIQTNIVKSAASKAAQSPYQTNDAVAANRSTKYNSASRDKFLNGGTAPSKASTQGTRVVADKKSVSAGKNVISSRGNISSANKYNQAYWANQIKAKDLDKNGKNHGGAGRTQADVLNQQKKLGIKKAYSGDKVVTTANKDTAHFKLKKLTGSDATLGDGVTKSTKKSGLFGENTTNTYDYKRGPTVTTKASNHGILGGTKSTTYVDDIATNTITNRKNGKNGVGTVTTLADADALGDTVKADNIVSVSGSTNTAGTDDGSGDPVVVKPIVITKKATPPTTVAAPAATLGGASAGNSVQPDAIKNQLAIKKNKQRKGKRGLRTAGASGANFGGKGTGLNIAV